MANESHEQAAPHQSEETDVLRGLEHVRKRPGMYIGDVGQKGLHWTVFQLVANALAEAAEGHGRSVKVRLNADGSVEVEDEGRGIDPAPHSTLGKPLLETLLTDISFHGSRSPGRNWRDYAIANALSEWLCVETRHDGRVYQQNFRHGEPAAAPRQVGPSSGSGIKVAFKPDPAIFADPRFSYAVIRDRLREYAFLHSGVQLSVFDEATKQQERFEYEDGIRAFVEMLNRGRQPLHPEVLVVRGEQAGVKFEVGLQWCRERAESTRSFVNDHETAHGGTHVTGFRAGVTRSINSFIRLKGQTAVPVLKGESAREGLTAIVSVQMDRPKFDHAMKAHLISEEAQRAVGAGVRRFLQQFFESNAAVAEAVIQAATTAAGDGG